MGEFGNAKCNILHPTLLDGGLYPSKKGNGALMPQVRCTSQLGLEVPELGLGASFIVLCGKIQS